MDAVSHLLRMARLEAGLDKRCLLGGATRMDVAGRTGPEAWFHVLLDGECRLQVGATAVDMRSGDVVLIPSGAAHRVTTPGTGTVRGTTETDGDAVDTIRSSSGAASVVDLFCGHYRFDAGAGAVLFRSLPEPLHVSLGGSAEDAETLRMLGAMMRAEARQDGKGGTAILSALSTVLLAMVLRSSRGPATAAALWTAVTDDRVARVVEAVLGDPGTDWTIDRLSRAAAMSRATFLRHFGQETGMTVGAFLVRARTMAAAHLLNTSDATVATIAGQVGYQSESAFSRAFRAEVGTTPARFRRTQRQRPEPGRAPSGGVPAR